MSRFITEEDLDFIRRITEESTGTEESEEEEDQSYTEGYTPESIEDFTGRVSGTPTIYSDRTGDPFTTTTPDRQIGAYVDESSGSVQFNDTFMSLVNRYNINAARQTNPYMQDHGNPNPLLRILPRLYEGNYTVGEALGLLFSGSPSDLSQEALDAAGNMYFDYSGKQVDAVAQMLGIPSEVIQDQLLQQNAVVDPERAANDNNEYSQWEPETPVGRFINDLQGDVDELFKDASEGDVKAQAAKKGLNAMLQAVESLYETDYMQTSQAVTLKAAGDLMQTVAGAVSLLGNNPEDTALHRLGTELAALGNDTYSEEFQTALKDIEQRIGEAKGFEESATAIFGALVDHPTEFLVDYVGVEILQEIPLLVASGGVATAARGVAKAGGVAKEVAERIGDKIGFGTGIVLDLGEAGFGAAGQAYEEALDSLTYQEKINPKTGEPYTIGEAGAAAQRLVDTGKINPNTGKAYTQEEAEAVKEMLLRKAPINPDTGEAYTQEEAEDAAQTVAIKASVTGVMLAAGGMFLGGNALEEYLRRSGKEASEAIGSGVATVEDVFDDFVADMSDAVFENAPKNVKETVSNFFGELIDRVGEITEIGLKEGLTEGIEEGGVSALIENELYKLGDLQRDVEGNIAKDTILGAIIGGPTSSGIAGTDMITNALINANPQVNKVMLEANAAVEGGADPALIAQSIQENLTGLGIDQPYIQNSLANEVYDAGYLTETEVVNTAGALGVDLLPAQVEGLAGDTDELAHMQDLIADITENIYGKPSDAEFDVNNDGVLTGQELVEREQALEAWEENNLDADQLEVPDVSELDTDGVAGLSEDEFTSYVNAVGNVVTQREVDIDTTRRMFNNLGYTPTNKEVFDYKNNQAGIPDYIDPRQLTREELEAVAAAEGYALKDSDYDRVGQGGADFEQVESDSATTAFDALALSTQEIKDAAAAEGYVLSNAEAEALAGNIAADTTEAEALKVEQDKFDAGALSVQEITDAAAAEGYTLAEGEALATMLPPGTTEAEALANLQKDFDSRSITAEELEAIAAAEGYTLTDADRELIGNVTGDQTDDSVLSGQQDVFDNLVITAEELEEVAAATGYTLTDADRELIGAVGEGESAAEILAQQRTAFGESVSEAAAVATRAGYETQIRDYITNNNGNFTEAEIQTFVDQAVEDGTVTTTISNIGTAINTAAQEALDAAEAVDTGTTDDGTEVVDDGTTDDGTTDEGTTDEGTTDEGTTDVGTEVGEVSTADQIREILRAEGIETFDDAAINSLAGLVDAEALSIDDITQDSYEDFIDARDSRGTMGPDTDAGTDDVGTDDGTTDDGAGVDEGKTTSERVRDALAAIGAENLIPALVDKLIQDVVSGTVDIADVAEEYKTLAAANQGDADADTGDQDADPADPADPADTDTDSDSDTDLSDQVDLEDTTISGDPDDYVKVGDFNREVGTLEDNIVKLINQLEANGIDRYDAIAVAVGVPAGQEGGPSGLYAELGKFATVNQVDALRKVVDGIASKVGTTASDVAAIKSKMVDLVTKADIAGLATKEDLKTLLTAEDIAGLATQQDVLNAEGRLKNRIKALQDEGKTRFDAIDIALGELAAEVGSTQEGVKQALAKFQLDINADIAELATKKQVAAVEANILARIDAYELQGFTRDEAIKKSLADANQNIDQLADDLGTTKDELTKQLTDFQVKLDADLSKLATKKQVNELETELFKTLQEYEDAGVDRDIALQAALQELGTKMGLTTQQLLDRIGTSEQNLNTRIGEIETAIQEQIKTEAQTTRDMVTDTATETQTQIQQANKASAFRDFFDLVVGSEDLEGQKVTVGQSPLAQIDYVYDFQSPFATQQQAGFYGSASPYGAPMAASRQRRPQTVTSAMQGPLNLRGLPGMAKGGKVDYDFLGEISQIMSFGD